MLIVRIVNKTVLSCRMLDLKLKKKVVLFLRGCGYSRELTCSVDIEVLSCEVFPQNDPHLLLRLGAGWLLCLGV